LTNRTSMITRKMMPFTPSHKPRSKVSREWLSTRDYISSWTCDSIVRKCFKLRCFIKEFLLNILAILAPKEFIKWKFMKVKLVSVKLTWFPFSSIINGWTSSSKSNSIKLSN
jgi:hypothetical protein